MKKFYLTYKDGYTVCNQLSWNYNRLIMNIDNEDKRKLQEQWSSVFDHFVVGNKMVEIGSGAERKQKDYKLTPYVSYDIHKKIGKIVRKAIKQAGRNYARRIAYA